MQSLIFAIAPATLTNKEAEEYCSKRVFWDWLKKAYNIKPLFLGPGERIGRTTIFSRDAIDHALKQLELNGGFDLQTGRPIREQ